MFQPGPSMVHIAVNEVIEDKLVDQIYMDSVFSTLKAVWKAYSLDGRYHQPVWDADIVAAWLRVGRHDSLFVA